MKPLAWLWARRNFAWMQPEGGVHPAWILDWQRTHQDLAPHGLGIVCECPAPAEGVEIEEELGDYYAYVGTCGGPASLYVGGMMLCEYCAGGHLSE